MNDWQKSTQNINFRGHDEVLSKISVLKNEKKSLVQKISDLIISIKIIRIMSST
ncbi:MAG: hypothetical protein IBX70_10845 [Clostridia bacterium]|nr:hypothetical protein [Clostridia bacterium]